MRSRRQVPQLAANANASINLDAARRGNLDELENLQARVPTLPSSALPEILEIFLSHFDTCNLSSAHMDIVRNASGADTAKKLFCTLAFTAMRGIHTVASSSYFRSNPALLKIIFGKWDTVIDTVTMLYDELHQNYAREHTNSLIQSMIHILECLGTADERKLSNVLRGENAQVLIYKFWANDLGDEWDLACSTILIPCFTWKSTTLDYLLKAGPAQKYAHLAVKRMNASLCMKGIEMKLKYASIYAIIASTFVIHPGHEVAIAMVKEGGTIAILRSLRLLLDHAPDIMSSPAAIMTASSAFNFLYRAFEVRLETRAVTLRKAVRRGFIKVLCGLSPWFQQLETASPDVLGSLKHFFISSLPRDMVYSRSIKVLSDAFKELTDEDRKMMSESMFKEEWRNVEMLLIERHANFRLMVISKRIRSCDACGKNFIKHSLMRCTGCMHALYCSKDCQARAWKSMNHKSACKNRADGRVYSKRVFEEGILEHLSAKDLKRHLLGAAQKLLGAPENFDPNEHIVKLYYVRFPVEFKIVKITEFLGEHPIDPETVRLFLTGIRFGGGRRVLCAQYHGNATERMIEIVTLKLDEFWVRDAKTLMDDRKRLIPRAIVRVGDDPAPVETRMDSIDLLLSFCGATFEDYWKTDFDQIALLARNPRLLIEMERNGTLNNSVSGTVCRRSC